MIQLSDEPKPASAPVSGGMKPITMSLVPLPPVVDVEPPLAPLMFELQASSRPPPPTTAALAPAVRSRPRRLIGPPALSPWGDETLIPPRPPRVPDDAFILSGCAVWSLMCNRS